MSLELSNTVTLAVSIGEALDKLTILDIKLEKIQYEDRRADVKKEYDMIYESLEKYVTLFPYHYRILRDINLTLWNIQDLFHGKDTTKEQGAEYCRQILLENDRRFRMKAKINGLINSTYKEQKGYTPKKAVVYGHLGLGDMFWLNGAVRYLVTCYDEVVVVCKERNSKNASAMYADDPAIKLLVIRDDGDLHPWSLRREYFKESGYAVYDSGFFAAKQTEDPTLAWPSETCGGRIQDLPNSFYDDMEIPRSYRQLYFYVPRTKAAVDLAALYEGTPYLVLHQESSVQTLDIARQLREQGETRLLLDLNKNLYEPTQSEWALAQHVVGKPLLEYAALFGQAEELHMIESSLYCMASHLDLSAVKRKVCYLPWGGNAERLGVFTTGDCPYRRA